MTRASDKQILDLFQRLGILRPADLEAHGIPRAHDTGAGRVMGRAAGEGEKAAA